MSSAISTVQKLGDMHAIGGRLRSDLLTSSVSLLAYWAVFEKTRYQAEMTKFGYKRTYNMQT